MRRNPLALLLISWFLLTGGAAFGAADDRARLVGAWRFQKEAVTRADGTPVDEPAAPTEGFLVYTPDGFMSVQVLPKGRKWSLEKATLEELRQTVDATSYAGRYDLDPANHTVTHRLEVSIDPSYEGQSLVRHYRFEGDALLLSGDFKANGQAMRFTITWVRPK